MTLLQNSWLDILVLDHIFRQVKYKVVSKIPQLDAVVISFFGSDQRRPK